MLPRSLLASLPPSATFKKNSQPLLWNLWLNRTMWFATVLTIPALVLQVSPGLKMDQLEWLLPVSSLSEQQLAWMVWGVFFLLQELCSLVLLAPLASILPRLGLRTGMILGQSSLILSFALLTSTSSAPHLIWLASLFLALSGSLLSLTQHLYLLQSRLSQAIGHSELTSLEILQRVLLVIAPILGILWFEATDFSGIFLITMLGSLLALLPILSLSEVPLNTKWQWRNFSIWIRSTNNNWSAFTLAGASWEALGWNIFWPAFLLFAVTNLMGSAYILAAGSFFALLIIYLMAEDFRRFMRLFPQKLLALLQSIFWVLRWWFHTTPFGLVILDLSDHVAEELQRGKKLTLLPTELQGRNPVLITFNSLALSHLTRMLGLLLFLPVGILTDNWLFLFLSFSLASSPGMSLLKKLLPR